MIEILPTDDYRLIANKIFYQFEIHQSTTVRGFVQVDEDLFSMGELVKKELEKLDTMQYFENNSLGKKRRKRVKLPDTIGGFVAQKIFKYKSEKREKTIIWSFWRIQ